MVDLLHSPLSKNLYDFIKFTIKDFVTWDIIVFFFYNQDGEYTIEEINSNIGRPIKEILDSLNNLCLLRIIAKKMKDEKMKYSYIKNNDVKDNIDEFVQNLNSRTNRMFIPINRYYLYKDFFDI